jgi:probable F420-dependent oxidoreductase
MRVSCGLPTHRVDLGDEFVTAAAIGELSAAAERAGFDAVYVTEHPFPSDEWLATGGHHALDPMVALAAAAAATTAVRLHTNLLIPAYRNPFLPAKAVASLDVVSGGRVILGIGVGYLEDEFDALGAPFDDRNDRTDDAIEAMKAAWTGETVQRQGPGYDVRGNTMLPRPLQRPRPPIWIGGNTKRAIRRAVEHADGWSPFPIRAGARTRTAAITGLEELAARLAFARSHAESVGRRDPLDVIFIPSGMGMGDGGVDHETVVVSCERMASIGVTWAVVGFAGETRAAEIAAMEDFGAKALPVIAGLAPGATVP